jgi:tetrapyrrole methylase family protein/MazG family protein
VRRAHPAVGVITRSPIHHISSFKAGFRRSVSSLVALMQREQSKARLPVLAATCKFGQSPWRAGSFVHRRKPKGKLRSKVESRSRVSARPVIPITRRDKLAGKWFERLVALQAHLYGPGGCPWDREQTHASLRKYLIEETYEVLDAMDGGDPRKFSAELGDLLLQVIFHAVLAEQAGRFTISDVIESVHTKMVRRHPHVFGDTSAADSAAVLKNWEQIKAEERLAEPPGTPEVREERVAPEGRPADGALRSVLAGVPRSLPAVLEAYQLTRRASHVGFDWDNLPDLLAKLDEEKRELREALPAQPANGRVDSPSERVEEEVGDLLFVAVNIARFVGVDPEIALKKANRKFKQRFTLMEALAAREGRSFAGLPRERMEELWNRSKSSE